LHGARRCATLSAANGQRVSHGRIIWECCAVVRGVRREVRLGRPALGVALRENLLRMQVRGAPHARGSTRARRSERANRARHRGALPLGGPRWRTRRPRLPRVGSGGQWFSGEHSITAALGGAPRERREQPRGEVALLVASIAVSIDRIRSLNVPPAGSPLPRASVPARTRQVGCSWCPPPPPPQDPPAPDPRAASRPF
jgi:hypothetical protein